MVYSVHTKYSGCRFRCKKKTKKEEEESCPLTKVKRENKKRFNFTWIPIFIGDNSLLNHFFYINILFEYEFSYLEVLILLFCSI